MSGLDFGMPLRTRLTQFSNFLCDLIHSWQGGVEILLASVVILAVTGIDRNYFNLACATALAVTVMMVVKTPPQRVAVIVMHILVLVVPGSPPPPLFDLQWQNGAEKPQTEWKYVHPGDQLRYEFLLLNYANRSVQCGPLTAKLMMRGYGLLGLKFKVDGARVGAVDTQGYQPELGVPTLRVKMEDVTAGTLVVSLMLAENAKQAEISQGQEWVGFIPYTDAVWLEMENDKCRLVYFAEPPDRNDLQNRLKALLESRGRP